MPKRRKTTADQRPTRDINAAMRAVAALDAAIAGHDWQTVAEHAGYSNRGAAFHAVQRELQRRIEPRVDHLRRMQWGRLQAYRTVFYPKAMAGDGWSLDRCLRIDEREAQLMGLDLPPQPVNMAAPVILEIPTDMAAAIRGDHLLAAKNALAVIPEYSPHEDQEAGYIIP